MAGATSSHARRVFLFRSCEDADPSGDEECEYALGPSVVLRRCHAVEHGAQARAAARGRRTRQPTLFRGARRRAGARARAAQRRRPAHRSSVAGRPRALATADRCRVHRGAPCGADFTRDARPARPPEPVLLLPGVQAVLRRATDPVSQQPAHRAGQAIVGQASAVGDRHRIDDRLQRDQLVHRGVSQGDRAHPHRVSPQPHVTAWAKVSNVPVVGAIASTPGKVRQSTSNQVRRGDYVVGLVTAPDEIRMRIRRTAMVRLLTATMVAALLGYGSAAAQVGGTGALPGPSPLGMTSPLGIGAGSPVSSTGIPMGATELATPGISPGPISGTSTTFTGATCPTTGTASTMTMGTPSSSMGTGSTMASGTTSSTGLFTAGGVGTDATQLGSSSPSSMSSSTCTQTTGTSTTTSPTPSTFTTGTTLGIPAIPLGSTGLGNAGLSPAPCPATGYTSSATNGTVSGSC